MDIVAHDQLAGLTSKAAQSARSASDLMAVALAQIAAVLSGLVVVVILAGDASAFDGRHGGQNVEGDQYPFLLSYAAPQPSAIDNHQWLRDQFQEQAGEEIADEPHPLNDAWMGMDVVTQEGMIVGFVSAAFVGDDGSIEELVVQPIDGVALEQPVWVEGEVASLEEEYVRLSITLARLQSSEPVDQFEMAADAAE